MALPAARAYTRKTSARSANLFQDRSRRLDKPGRPPSPRPRLAKSFAVTQSRRNGSPTELPASPGRRPNRRNPTRRRSLLLLAPADLDNARQPEWLALNGTHNRGFQCTFLFSGYAAAPAARRSPLYRYFSSRSRLPPARRVGPIRTYSVPSLTAPAANHSRARKSASCAAPRSSSTRQPTHLAVTPLTTFRPGLTR